MHDSPFKVCLKSHVSSEFKVCFKSNSLLRNNLKCAGKWSKMEECAGNEKYIKFPLQNSRDKINLLHHVIKSSYATCLITIPVDDSTNKK